MLGFFFWDAAAVHVASSIQRTTKGAYESLVTSHYAYQHRKMHVNPSQTADSETASYMLTSPPENVF